MSSIMRSPVKPLPCCPLLVSAQAPWSRWVEWPEVTVLALLCSLLIYHSSLIKLILLIGKPSSMSPSVCMTSPEGPQSTKPNLWDGIHLRFSKDQSRSLQKHKKFILALLFCGNKNQMELGNYKEMWEVITPLEFIKSLSQPPFLWFGFGNLFYWFS